MSERPTGGGAGESVVAALTEVAQALEEPAGRSRFLRGLAIGALVGAAIVGALLGMGSRRGAAGGARDHDRPDRTS